MSNNNKTLADAQPGGRVRLGDQAHATSAHDLETIERVAMAMQASENKQSGWTWTDCSSIEVEGWMDLARAAVAALSAQPSLGSQDAPEIEQLRALVSSILSTVSLGHQKGAYAYAGEDFGRYLAEAARDCRTILRALSDIAARQPVGEPVAFQLAGSEPLWCLHVLGMDDVHPAPSKAHAEKAAAWHNEQFKDQAERLGISIEARVVPWPHSAESHAAGVAEFIPQWLIPQWQLDALEAKAKAPAQAVDHEVTDAMVDKAWNRFEVALHADDGDTLEDRVLSETIDQRDRYHEMADDLAGHIAAITGVDIGEHSSANCPWQNAIEAAEEHKPAQPVDLGQTFQEGVAEWMGQCFLPSLYSNMTERGDRLLEEVLELLQAHGYDKARVPTLVDYVFGRPVGDPAQEVGGVMVTLAGYCWVAGLDMHVAGDAELARINQPEVMAKIRAKQEAKNALHFDTPLPGSADAHLPAQAIGHGEVTDAMVDKAWNRFEAALHADDGDTPEDRVLSETIDQRDRYHELADDLAGHLARITGVDIGEHSSANCPWQNAIEAADEYKPAQAVDLGQFRQPVQDWLDDAQASMEEHGDYDGVFGHAIEEGTRLLALIDGKAVGK